MNNYMAFGLTSLAISLLSGCTQKQGQELTIFAASSLTNAIDEIKADFEKKYRCQIDINMGSSGSLAQNIKRGTPCSIFMSSNAKFADELIKAGKATGYSRYVFAGNKLVVITNKESTQPVITPKDLIKFGKIAIGEPSSVPAGIYAKKELSQLGIWDKIEDKLIPANNVRAVLGYVEGNLVDAGIVYKTDAMISGNIKICYEFGDTGIEYVAVIISGSQHNELTTKFMERLNSKEYRAIFAKYGFE